MLERGIYYHRSWCSIHCVNWTNVFLDRRLHSVAKPLALERCTPPQELVKQTQRALARRSNQRVLDRCTHGWRWSGRRSRSVPYDRRRCSIHRRGWRSRAQAGFGATFSTTDARNILLALALRGSHWRSSDALPHRSRYGQTLQALTPRTSHWCWREVFLHGAGAADTEGAGAA